jgi:thymidylate kinase
MKKIEFIGASGVGKTTFYKELLALNKKNRIWKTPAEARIKIAKDMDIKDLKGLKKLYLLCLKLNIFPSRHSIFASFVLNNYMNEKTYNEIYKYDDLISLMLKAINDDNETEAFRKCKFIAFYINLIIHDVLALEDLRENELIVYDDGIVHNISGLVIEERFNMMTKKNHNILKYIFPQGVIFCELTVEENIKRRKKRIADGKGTFLENNISHEKIVQICRRSIDYANKKIILLEKFNIPVLKINMNDPVRENARLVNEFINVISLT